MHFIGNLGKIKLIIYNQFLHSLDFMGQEISFNRNAFHLCKKIGEVGIIVTEFLAQVIREVDLDLVFCIMHHFNNHTLNLFHQDASLVIHELQS